MSDIPIDIASLKRLAERYAIVARWATSYGKDEMATEYWKQHEEVSKQIDSFSMLISYENQKVLTDGKKAQQRILRDAPSA